MIQFTKQQLDKRWDILPVNLREILCSPDSGKIIWDVCEANHLTDEKIGKITRLCGFVIMGFLHQEDMVKEIKQELGLNLEIVKIIAQEVERKIFSPIKSEIDKAYALPLSSEEEVETEETEEPVVTDIRLETGGVKITREVKYAHLAEIEPMRIVGVAGEEKLVIPGAEVEEQSMPPVAESPAAPVMPEGPVVLHEEEEIKPVLGETKKKSLGELFGFLNGRESAAKKESASVASGVEYEDLNPLSGKEEIKKPEERTVHYNSALSTSLESLNPPVGGEKPEISEVEEPKKTESKPKLFFKNIIQAIKPTIKVVNFAEITDKPLEIDGPTKLEAEKPESLNEKLLIIETETIKNESLGINENEKESFFKKIFGFGKKKKEEQILEEETPKEILPQNEELKKEPERNPLEILLENEKNEKVEEIKK